MNGSLNSTSNLTGSAEAAKAAVTAAAGQAAKQVAKAAEEAAEQVADLTLNQDEVLDVELALGALGGIRHSAACDAAERSSRRFDERNHRLHESRMKALGMEGEEVPEDTDMSHQVLIRSPITHNHYSPTPTPIQTPTPPAATPSQPPAQPPATPPPATNGRLSPLATAALVLASLGLGSVSTYFLSRPTVSSTTIQSGDKTGIGLVPPGPPYKKKATMNKQ
jgi:hypothetical protein